MSLSWHILQSMLLPFMDRSEMPLVQKVHSGKGDKRTYQMNPANQLEDLMKMKWH